jgi:hypothetical protein
MSCSDVELGRLKAVERAAKARLDRLVKVSSPADEVERTAENLWKEAAETVRDRQETV